MTPRAAGIAPLLLATWLGINAVWGLTSPEDTLVSSFERGLAPLAVWVVGVTILLAFVLAVAVRTKQRGLIASCAMLLAYLVGVIVSRYAKLAVDPQGGIPLESMADAGRGVLERSFILIPALPMLAIGYLLCREDLPLRFGDWTAKTSSFASGTWGRSLLLVLVLIGLPCFLLMQSTVGFAPIRTGNLWPALVPVLGLALLNAFSEELLFRGLIQAPLVRYLGVSWGILLQASFFAIHHWGASPSIIAGAPMAVILLFAAIWMGRSVLATGGLAWAISFHAMLDFAFFSAHFVRTS